MSNVKFFGIECNVHKGSYKGSGQVALTLTVADTSGNKAQGYSYGSPVATATVAVPGYSFAKGETAIKDYSENQGILDSLVEAKVVELTGKEVSSGFVTLPIVRLI